MIEPPQPPEQRIEGIAGAFTARFGRAPEGVAAAPGRVNLIGEHLDYNEGLVLPIAIDRCVVVAYATRDDVTTRVWSLDFDEESSFPADRPVAGDEAHPWANYVRGVVRALREGGYAGRGVDLAITGDVPPEAGLSSSAALEVATLGALRAAWGLDIDDRGLALLGQRAENEFVGVQCGIMDQFAAALAAADHALLIDCRTLAVEHVPLRLEESGLALVVVDSGQRRRLEASAYNRRCEECAGAFRALRAAMPQAPAALRDVSPGDLERFGGCLPPELLRRARHVVTEQERVHSAVEALRRDDFQTFGQLMSESHASLRDDFEVSTPQLDRLVVLAQAEPGVLGSRLTGAGFGGCAVSLVQASRLEAFAANVVQRYRSETALDANMYVCHPSDGLRTHEVRA